MTTPLSSAQNQRQDRPTAGVFFGTRFGSRDFGISPEIGVHYDPSVRKLYERTIVVVPVVSFHGSGVLERLFGL